MADFEVSFDGARFRRAANAKIDRQIPFAFSLALNETIEDVQGELIDDLPSTFTIRSKWTAKGIRIKGATKKRLIAVVGSRDSYMALQATGGTYSRYGDFRKHAVPVRARRNKASKTPRSRWPSALIAKGAFIADFGSGSAVWMATKHKNPKRRKLRLMYRLVDSITVPQRWDLEGTLRKVVRREWRGNVARGLRQALQTRRR